MCVCVGGVSVYLDVFTVYTCGFCQCIFREGARLELEHIYFADGIQKIADNIVKFVQFFCYAHHRMII